MKRTKVRRKVGKERIENNPLRVRGYGGLLQRFMAERELLQSTGQLAGQQESPCLHCSGTQLHSNEDTPKHQSRKGFKAQEAAYL